MARGHIATLEQARAVVRQSFQLETYTPGGDRAAWDDAYSRYLRLSQR